MVDKEISVIMFQQKQFTQTCYVSSTQDFGVFSQSAFFTFCSSEVNIILKRTNFKVYSMPLIKKL